MRDLDSSSILHPISTRGFSRLATNSQSGRPPAGSTYDSDTALDTGGGDTMGADNQTIGSDWRGWECVWGWCR